MKPKREISFGEWQDECAKHYVRPKVVDCSSCDERIKSVCKQHDDGKYPCGFDLTDPPRFTEAQMAFWRGWYEMGAKSAYQNEEELYFYNGDQRNSHTCLGSTRSHISGIWIKNGETLDLAEMFGKEGEK